MKFGGKGMIMEKDLSGESKEVEYKETLPEKSYKYMKTVVAFANGQGGKIIFGVKDDGCVIGIDKDTIFKTMDAITNAISDSCEPMILPDISLQDVEDKTLIVVEIDAGKQRPYYVKSLGLQSGTFIRSAGTTRLAESYMIKELMLEGTNGSFDQLIAEGQTVTKEEIDALCKDMTAYAQKMCSNDEERAQVPILTQSQLISWGLLIERNGELLPSNGFCLLVGKTIPSLQASVQCAVFKGKDRTVFLDRKIYEGSIQNQVDQAYDFVLRSIRMGASINGLYRQDLYELPLATIREMICNAICHRSYLEPANVQVALYDDRLEVTSPGMLLGGVSLEKMKQGYSKIRNRAIVRAFTYMKIIENWGSGIPRMFYECHEYGMREPELIENNGDFRVNIYRGKQSSSRIDVSMQMEKTTQTLPKHYPNTTQTEENYPNTTQTLPKHYPNTTQTIRLTQSDIAVIELIRKFPEITQKELALQLHWKIDRVKYYTKKLSEIGILTRKGTHRKGYWLIHMDEIG